MKVENVASIVKRDKMIAFSFTRGRFYVIGAKLRHGKLRREVQSYG